MDKMTEFTFVMLACLFVLFGWVQYSVVRRAWRKRLAVFGGGAILRYGGSAILFGFACFCFICGRTQLKTGAFSSYFMADCPTVVSHSPFIEPIIRTVFGKRFASIYTWR
jgi:hypothetical protein